MVLKEASGFVPTSCHLHTLLKTLLDLNLSDVATFSGYLENMAKRKINETEKINEERSGNGVGMSQPKKSKHEESDVRNWSISDVSDFLRSEGYEDEITTKFVGKKFDSRSREV